MPNKGDILWKIRLPKLQCPNCGMLGMVYETNSRYDMERLIIIPADETYLFCASCGYEYDDRTSYVIRVRGFGPTTKQVKR